MGGSVLFGDSESFNRPARAPSEEAEDPRLVRPNRKQKLLQIEDVDGLIPQNHRARALAAVVDELDLASFYAPIKARGSSAGRPATDPKMLLTLWLFATSEGVGSGRQLARLCDRDAPYRWICGGVCVSYHTLTDFRVEHGAALDDLMTQVLAVMMKMGVVRLKRVAQDGMRVRAAAGAASFHREETLDKHLKTAREQVLAAKEMLDKDDPTRSDKQKAATARAAKAREKNTRKALKEVRRLQSKKPSRKSNSEPRASTTDPDAKVMRMADGGFRPAVNVQIASDTSSGAIVGIGVTDSGTDQGHISSMLDEVERRTGARPKEVLVDGGYVSRDDIDAVENSGTTVFAPVPEARTKDVDPHEPKKDDTKAVARWRRRMKTERAKKIYKQRASTAERVNGILRTHRGFDRLPVRGLANALKVGLLMALTHNLLILASSIAGA